MTKTETTVNERPKTAEDVMALPECGGFGMEEREIDGKRVRVPVVPQFELFWQEDDEPMMVRDGDGACWRPRKYVGGGFCRQRM